MKEVREFKLLATVENPELNLLWSTLGEVWSNQFIAELLISGVLRWENMLKLRPLSTDTIEDRRIRILAKINEQIPYTYRRMIQILNALCGEGLYDVDLDHNTYQLSILINPDITGNIDRISKTLYPIIPANLSLYLAMQMYQAWKIKHPADSLQIVDAHHIVWNLGEIQRAYWDGEFNLDSEIRLNAIRPDTNYRESQQHTAQFQIYIDARQTNCQQYNLLDGSFCFDGSHIWRGEIQKSAIGNGCTIGGEYV
jgi:hypothetical protein